MSKAPHRLSGIRVLGGLVPTVALPLAGLVAAASLAQHAHAAQAGEFDPMEAAAPGSAMGEGMPDQARATDQVLELGSGVASYYGDRFAGKSTASGELYDPAGLTAAHPSLAFGSRVLVTSEQTGQSVVVTINDRGPFHGGRIIDLSRAAASRIGLLRQGRGAVSLALLAE